MTHEHMHMLPTPWWWLPGAGVVLAAAAGAWAVLALRRRGDAWPVGRTVSALAGLVALGAAVLPPLADAEPFPLHVVQHLLLAMVAPLLLALGAPVTLALRTVPPPARRVVLAVVHSRAARVVMWPPLVLLLDVGAMYAYYLTGLFPAAHAHPLLHLVLHAHMFLAGCLLSWLLVGADPVVPRRSTRGSMIVLFVAAGAHDVLAKLMVALGLPEGAGSARDLRLGAQIMFSGGDVVELALAAAVMWSWYARTGRALARERRRAAHV